MGATDGPEHENQDRQAEDRSGAVLEQLQPYVSRGELLRRDSGADDDRHEQAGAEQLSDGAAPRRQMLRSHANSLTQDINSVKIESMNTDPVDVFRARVAKHAALADPARLRIVDLLTLGDLSPTELQAELGMPVKPAVPPPAHAGRRGPGDRHRSEADKRRSYIRLAAGALEGLAPGREQGARRILFVCTRNSARSQLAIALWNRVSEIPATSAGTHPADRIAPGAIDVASRHGVALADLPPRRLDDVARDGDCVVTVCDSAHEEIPNLGGVHWSVPDPLRLNTEDAFEGATLTSPAASATSHPACTPPEPRPANIDKHRSIGRYFMHRQTSMLVIRRGREDLSEPIRA